MTPQGINFNLFNMHNITIEQITNGNKDKLPRNGDNIKIRTIHTNKSERITEFVYIFNFTLGNYIRITKIANAAGEIVERVARLVTPQNLLDVYEDVLKKISEA